MKLPFFSKKPKTLKDGAGARVHLDYAAATPVHPEVLVAMQPYFSDLWANPGALYQEGVAARAIVEEQRTELARILHVRPEDVTFTSGGTEANNMAIHGVVEWLHAQGRSYEDMEVITLATEHPSILEAVGALSTRGVSVTYAPIHEDGRIDTQAFAKLLTEKTVLVSCAYVNSEIGVVQDIKKISRTVRKWREQHLDQQIFVHTDACQAPLWLPCMLDMLGVDLLSLDAGKCYGPKGSGVLIHRHWVSLAPFLHGGGQERGLRSGTENVPLIVGCVRALVRAQSTYETRASRVKELREYCIDALQKHIPHVVINGSREARVANNINMSLLGVDTEYLTIWLDAQGFAVSTKSACGAGKGGGSIVVYTLTGDQARAQSTLRITLGEASTQTEIDMLVSKLTIFLDTMQLKNVK